MRRRAPRGSRGGTRSPAPSVTSSGIPPEAVVTTGTPAAIDFDQRDRHAFLVAFLGGNARKHDRVPADPRWSLSRSSECEIAPRKVTGRPRARCSSSARSGPSPATSRDDPLQPGEGLEEVSVPLTGRRFAAVSSLSGPSVADRGAVEAGRSTPIRITVGLQPCEADALAQLACAGLADRAHEAGRARLRPKQVALANVPAVGGEAPGDAGELGRRSSRASRSRRPSVRARAPRRARGSGARARGPSGRRRGSSRRSAAASAAVRPSSDSARPGAAGSSRAPPPRRSPQRGAVRSAVRARCGLGVRVQELASRVHGHDPDLVAEALQGRDLGQHECLERPVRKARGYVDELHARVRRRRSARRSARRADARAWPRSRPASSAPRRNGGPPCQGPRGARDRRGARGSPPPSPGHRPGRR